MGHHQWALCALLLTPLAHADEPGVLLPPVQIQAGGKALDVQRQGHSAPFVGDFYQDGGLCLLVGEFNEGRLRIYRNAGTTAKPRFDEHTWFEAGGKLAGVPVG
jgi:hypothetical protein